MGINFLTIVDQFVDGVANMNGMYNLLLNWLLPIGIMVGLFASVISLIRVLYQRTDIDRLWTWGVSVVVTLGVLFIIIKMLSRFGVVAGLEQMLHFLNSKLLLMIPPLGGFNAMVGAKIHAFWLWFKAFSHVWFPVYFRAFCIVFPIGTAIAVWSLVHRISFYRGANILLSYAVIHPYLMLKYLLGYASPAFDYINSRLFVAQLKENLNDSYFDALQGVDEKGKKFQDGAGGTSSTQTKKAVALAMRYTKSTVETVGGNRNNRHAKLTIMRSRETETDNMIQNTLKGFGSRINVPFVQFQETPTFNPKEKGYVFDSDVNYHAGKDLGSWSEIFNNPLKIENKKTNGGRGTLTTFFIDYANMLRYFFHLTPYAMYDRIRSNAKIKFARDTSADKAKYIARQNIDLSILPTPVDAKTGNTSDVQRKEALQRANERINDITSALNANKIRGTFDSVAVGGSNAIYKYTLPRDPDLPSDFSDIQTKMANMLKTASEPIITLSAGVLTVSITNQGTDGQPINIPVSFADMIRNREKGMKNIITGMAGVDAFGKNIYVELGDSMPHMMLFGATGRGKTVTIMDILYSIMDAVTPDDLRIEYIDGKGNSFEFMRTDEGAKHPNPFTYAQPADASGDIDYARALILHTENVVRRRIQIFKERGVSKLAEFNKQFPDEKMYEILMVFDEFSAVTDKDSDLKGDDYNKLSVTKHMEYLLKMARSAGVRVIMANQTARKSKVPGELTANIPGRLSLGVTEPIEAEIALPESGIAIHKVAQAGEFYSIMHGSGNPEHGNSPFLPDDQMNDLNDSLESVFGHRDYVVTRDEVLAEAEDAEPETEDDSYDSPSEQEMPTADTSINDLIGICKKYPEWFINNENSPVITGNKNFTEGSPAKLKRNKANFDQEMNVLKAKYEKSTSDIGDQKTAGTSISTMTGINGDFDEAFKEKIRS